MFDPEDFRRLAADMLQHKCSAAQSRTAISRAYYAAFLLARRYLEPYFRFEAGAKCHEQMRQVFLGCADARIKEIGRKLDDMRVTRNEADYDLTSTEVDHRQRAQLEENKSGRVIKDLKAIFTTKDKDAVLDEMRKWARDSNALEIRQTGN